MNIYPKKLYALAFLSLALISTLSCSRNNSSTSNNQTVTIKGSDTMVHLVSDWAEAYMKTHREVQVSVTGGGSGTGIAALLNGTTDIAMSSRSLDGKEKSKAGEAKIDPVEYIVGRDGIAIVVHPSNPVKELTMDQLKQMYTGAVTNWKDVGGPNAEILLLSRESSSGTYAFFQEHVLQKADYAQKTRLMPATSAILQSAASDVNAIGYVGLGYALKDKKVKILNVKLNATSAAVTPSEETVKNDTYPISRPLFLYATSGAKGGKGFLDFALSAEGQKIVRDTGYVPN